MKLCTLTRLMVPRGKTGAAAAAPSLRSAAWAAAGRARWRGAGTPAAGRGARAPRGERALLWRAPRPRRAPAPPSACLRRRRARRACCARRSARCAHPRGAPLRRAPHRRCRLASRPPAASMPPERAGWRGARRGAVAARPGPGPLKGGGGEGRVVRAGRVERRGYIIQADAGAGRDPDRTDGDDHRQPAGRGPNGAPRTGGCATSIRSRTQRPPGAAPAPMSSPSRGAFYLRLSAGCFVVGVRGRGGASEGPAPGGARRRCAAAACGRGAARRAPAAADAPAPAPPLRAARRVHGAVYDPHGCVGAAWRAWGRRGPGADARDPAARLRWPAAQRGATACHWPARPHPTPPPPTYHPLRVQASTTS
jgi:hypothetical protein